MPEQITTAGRIPLLAEPGEHTSPMPWDTVVAARPDVLTSLPGWSTLPAAANP
ncbi:hypothetical protein [Amycolatopsis jejuensis]|uniref:hypothetical protein n=1 Tax=Amycolatopsis jejuensis TaxID=330084 RepID=UPI000B1E39D9|nr:hypothetical protein [Amycolatopsis jejuensis]